MSIKLLPLLLAILTLPFASHATRYAGGDISLLPEYEAAGAVYRDHNGKPIADLLPWLRDQGMNAMRVRLFVSPSDHKAMHPDSYDPNACQDLEYIIPLCRRIVDNGFSLLLDFHYSDTWADPAKQWIPESWKGLSDEELYDRIYDYTRECLTTLKEEGIVPDFIQPGNEISYGMLWGNEGDPESELKKTLRGSSANWDRLGRLLNRAIEACREVCPDARIIIHNERVAQPDVLTYFYTQMNRLGVDYDIIGLSYYPYFQGSLTALRPVLATLRNNFSDKETMIVETGYSYKWEVPGSEYDNTATWPYSDAGQAKFASDLVETLERFDNVDGLFWWWLEYNPYSTTLSNWYNAPLFDGTTGRATSALEIICGYADDSDSGVETLPADDNAACNPDATLYDLQGRPVTLPVAPGIYIRNGRKIRIGVN